MPESNSGPTDQDRSFDGAMQTSFDDSIVWDALSSGNDGVTTIDDISPLGDEEMAMVNDSVEGGEVDIDQTKPPVSTGKEADDDSLISPNEVVYSGSRVYDKYFIFSQVMGWVHAGTDQKVGLPDVFGCVQLPTPAQCFGNSAKSYGPGEKKELVDIIKHVVKQTWPWSEGLRSCFSDVSADNAPGLLGSPMVDASLGMLSTITKVVGELGDSSRASAALEDQYDDKLPPEAPSQWVQCDRCKKWRRVRWDVDESSLPDNWVCAMNDWNPESASCDAPDDDFDPDQEGHVGTVEADGNANMDQYVVGTYRDVYCIKNLIFYEAKIVAVKPPENENELGQVKFHFKGWNANTDEWIDAGSPRIAPHHSATVAISGHNISAQEKHQGFKPEKLKTTKQALMSDKIGRLSSDVKAVKMMKKTEARKHNSNNSSLPPKGVVTAATSTLNTVMAPELPKPNDSKTKISKEKKTYRSHGLKFVPVIGDSPGNATADDVAVDSNTGESPNKRRRRSNGKFYEDFLA